MDQHQFTCQRCACVIGKNEAQFIDEDSFAFLTKLPNGLSLGTYCAECFEAHAKPALEDYSAKMEKAKDVNVYYSSQSKESRLVRRTEKPVRVEDCQDRDEVVMRLAFLAVEAGKNSLVDVELTSVKVRNGGWQSSRWSGVGIPAQISDADLKRKFSGSSPN